MCSNCCPGPPKDTTNLHQRGWTPCTCRWKGIKRSHSRMEKLNLGRKNTCLRSKDACDKSRNRRGGMARYLGHIFGAINWNKSLHACKAKAAGSWSRSQGRQFPARSRLSLQAPHWCQEVTEQQQSIWHRIKLAKHLGIEITHHLCSWLLQGSAPSSSAPYTAE